MRRTAISSVLLAALVLPAVPSGASDRAGALRAFEEAAALHQKGDFKGAFSAVNEAVEKDARLAAAYELRARLWHAVNHSAREREDARRVIELLGTGFGSRGLEELVALCGAQLVVDKPDRAMATCNAALKQDSASAEALSQRARVWRAQGENARAVADLDEAIKAAKTPLRLYARARARYDMGEDMKAVGDLTLALRGNKGFAAAYALVGAALARKGDLKRAAKAYDKSLSLDGESAYAWLGRAALKLRLGDEPGALKDFEEAVRADAQDYAPYFNRGEHHWRSGRRDQALDDYRNALTSPKLAPDAAAAIGERYLSLQLWQEAADAYGRALALGGGTKPLLRRAIAWESLKDGKKALADLDEAARLDPDSAPIAVARGSLMARLGMDSEAQRELTRAVRLAPSDAAALSARASFYARTGKPTLALEDFDKALEADPKHAPSYNGRGALRANAFKEDEKALRDVMKAVELDPGEPGYRFNLGVLRLKNRLYRKAIAAFDEALELKGPAARVLERRADAKSQLGDHLGAMQDAEAALEKDPKNPSMYDTLGQIRLRARDNEQAVRDLSQALQLEPKNASALLHRGLAYGALGQLKAATADFRRALELEPDSKELWTNLCQARRLARDPREALKACERALALDSQHGAAYLHRALAWFELKQWARVVEDVETAWQLGTRRAEGLLARSIAHAASRQYKEAHRTYLRAIALDPFVRSHHIGFAAGHPEGKDYLSMLVDLDAALQKDLDDPFVFVLRGDSLHSAEQFDKAVLEYTKAMELDGTLPDAYIGRGVSLTAQDALDAAQQDFVRAIELAPDDQDARVKLAVVLTMRRNYRAALGELGKAVKIDERAAEPYLRAGNVHYFLREFPKALENYTLAVKADPLDANALNGLGLGFFAMRKNDQALEAFSRAIAVNPLSSRFYRNRASVWTALQKYGNAAGDFRTASMVNTDPTLVDEYRRLIEEAEARSARGKSS
jgi:tetratricopeptide (TPR) repeat protein